MKDHIVRWQNAANTSTILTPCVFKSNVKLTQRHVADKPVTLQFTELADGVTNIHSPKHKSNRAAQNVNNTTLTTTTTTTSALTATINCDSKHVHNSSFLTHKHTHSNRRNFVETASAIPKSQLIEHQQQYEQQCLATGLKNITPLTLSSSLMTARVVEKRRDFIRFLLFCLHLGAFVYGCALNVVLVAGDATVYELDYEAIADGNMLSGDGRSHYTHTWAVHIPNGDTDGLADTVARDNGFMNLGRIFDDHYHFAHHKVSKRSLTPATAHQTYLDADHRVYWSQQQRAKSRQKRDFIRMRPSRTSPRSLSLVDAVPFSDPKWVHMWYLNRGGGLDMNVIPAWKEGITGKGIVVTILDDGLESNHPDIEHNYDANASYDVNSHDNDPMPRYDLTDSNRHGTRCAGEVAATANNSICAVGIAFGASVGGVRMLDGDVTDAVEARSLSLNPQHIDIYSASWGPDDDGKTVDGPGELASRAFIEGVTKGRNGKGSIFIWASGNGGRELDNCNCDGYTNSIWTLSISSATEEGHVPWYSEKCSSTLATTYSSGGQTEKQVVTTDLHHSCTVSHTGTSASAPLAAGIAALVLESNQNLTWRDLQHIVVRTAKPANLRDPYWSKNGVGRRISHSFGYGLMDAAAMVKVARTWKTVPEQQRCEINAPHVDKMIPPKSYITLQLTVKHCLSVNYLEHVQAKITLTSQRRGDIQLYLKSPAGTKVTLLTSRLHDVSRSGFNQWPFMSVHTWGESPHGNWQLEIHNEGRYMGHALLREWSLIFYGTTQPINPNDPMSTARSNSAENATPNTSSTSTTTTNLHQVYSPQYPRLQPNNFGTESEILGPAGGVRKIPLRLPANKPVYVASGNNHHALLGGSNAPSPSVATASGNKKKPQQTKQQAKQQSYQQISATYGLILNPLSKGNKNNAKGNGRGNGKADKASSNGSGVSAGGGGKSNAATKKEQNAAQSAKNKFYRILQQQQQYYNGTKKTNGKALSIGGGSSAQRNKGQSAEKQPPIEDKQALEVIGDLMPISTTNSKLPVKLNASGYAKLMVKATKQVKESVPASPLPTQAHPSQSNEKAIAVTGNLLSDQRIPKMFEQYEKIEAIFPEFQPYQGSRAESKKDPNGAIGLQDNQKQKTQDFAVESFMPFSTNAGGVDSATSNAAGATGSKPSRENSKKSSQSFIPSQRIIKKQELLLAAAGVSGGTQRPLSLDAATPNWKSSNAQITQWDLIFYGTETPAQTDDPVHPAPGQLDINYDMKHNDIEEYDTSGQWRNMKQVGDSNTLPNDKTSSACLRVARDQTCLACAAPDYLFNGRCYDDCPPHTYRTTLQPVYVPLSEDNNTEQPHNNNALISSNESGDDLQSTDRRKRQSDSLNDAKIETVLHSCAICDVSCSHCQGPSNSQCTACYAGSQLRKQQYSNDTFCYAFAERSSGNSHEQHDDDTSTSTVPSAHTKFALLGLVLLPSALVITAFFMVIALKHRCQRTQSSPGGAAQYSVLLAEDYEENTPNINESIVSPECESDSEEEIFVSPHN